MTKIVSQNVDNFHSFYLVFCSDGHYMRVNAKTNNQNEIEVDEAAYFSTSSFSLAKERLEHFKEEIVLINSPTIFMKKLFVEGTLVTPESYRVLISAWRSFRTSGSVPPLVRPELVDFMKYCSMTQNSHHYITRDEMENVCRMFNVRPTVHIVGGMLRTVVRGSGMVVYNETDLKNKIHNDTFIQVCTGRKTRITRVAENGFFIGIKDDISVIEFIVQDDYSVIAKLFNDYGDADDWVVPAKEFNLPYSLPELVAKVKDTSTLQRPTPEIIPVVETNTKAVKTTKPRTKKLSKAMD